MLRNVCERFHSECPPKEMKIGAVCHPRASLIFTHIFGWTLGAKVKDSALSLGERVAIPQSRESRVRGYLVMLDPGAPPRRATDPSPGPRPACGIAVHPLPLGEGKDLIPSLSPGGGVRQSTEDEESRCSAALRFAGPRFAKSRRPQKRRSALPSEWEGRRSKTCFSILLKHPSFCLLLFAFRLLPSAYCFPPTAYFTRPIPPAREPC
jgi:hypothetical protein